MREADGGGAGPPEVLRAAWWAEGCSLLPQQPILFGGEWSLSVREGREKGDEDVAEWIARHKYGWVSGPGWFFLCLAGGKYEYL